jgi:ribosomal protein L7/L12
MSDSTVLEIVAVISVSGLVISVLSNIYQARDRRLEWRISGIERTLDRLMRHLGVEEPADSLDEVRRLARSGQAIPAIKAYREQTGAGLRAAKDAVDAMVRDGASR